MTLYQNRTSLEKIARFLILSRILGQFRVNVKNLLIHSLTAMLYILAVGMTFKGDSMSFVMALFDSLYRFRISYLSYIGLPLSDTVSDIIKLPLQYCTSLQTGFDFLPARRYASAGYRDRNVSVRLSVRPSVRPSRAGIVSKRRKLAA